LRSTSCLPLPRRRTLPGRARCARTANRRRRSRNRSRASRAWLSLLEWDRRAETGSLSDPDSRPSRVSTWARPRRFPLASRAIERRPAGLTNAADHRATAHARLALAPVDKKGRAVLARPVVQIAEVGKRRAAVANRGFESRVDRLGQAVGLVTRQRACATLGRDARL